MPGFVFFFFLYFVERRLLKQYKIQNLQKLDLGVSVPGLMSCPQTFPLSCAVVISMSRLNPQPTADFGPMCEARPACLVPTFDPFKEGKTAWWGTAARVIPGYQAPSVVWWSPTTPPGREAFMLRPQKLPEEALERSLGIIPWLKHWKISLKKKTVSTVAKPWPWPKT